MRTVMGSKLVRLFEAIFIEVYCNLTLHLLPQVLNS